MQASERRNIIVAVRVTDAERKTLGTLADAEQASVSDLFRRRIGLPETADHAEATGQGRRWRRA